MYMYVHLYCTFHTHHLPLHTHTHTHRVQRYQCRFRSFRCESALNSCGSSECSDDEDTLDLPMVGITLFMTRCHEISYHQINSHKVNLLRDQLSQFPQDQKKFLLSDFIFCQLYVAWAKALLSVQIFFNIRRRKILNKKIELISWQVDLWYGGNWSHKG